GNPLARTILVECAWASLRYNPWAMLRDETDSNPGKMIDVTKSYGSKLPMDEETLRNMPKKECRHKRKRRLTKERKPAEQAKASED
ncbi:MAG: hypothetical protein AAF664_23760, partial [Planctomycetota bacterium]